MLPHALVMVNLHLRTSFEFIKTGNDSHSLQERRISNGAAVNEENRVFFLDPNLFDMMEE